MFQFPKSLVLAAAGIGLFSSVTSDVSACPRGGGGGGGYRVAYRPAYAPQQCQQPYYPQQYQQQPVQPQFAQQPQFAPPQFAQQQFAQQPPVFPQQQMQGGTVAGQGSNIVLQVGGNGGGQSGVPQGASVSALNALGGAGGVGGANAPVAQQGFQQAQGVQQQQGIQQGGQQGGQPAGGNVGFAGNAAEAPAAQAPVAQAAPVQGAPAQGAPMQSAPAQQNQQQAIDMALSALGGEQSAAASEQSNLASPATSVPQAAAPTGEFTATIANGTQIRLSLRADGSFLWLANKAGKASNFQGTFTINGGSLVLLRGSDNQKLEGSFTPTEGGFQLRLAGKTDNALAFVRG